MNPENLVQQAREAIDAGLMDEAVSIAKSRETKESIDPDMHLAWADVCEELNLTDDLIGDRENACQHRHQLSGNNKTS